LDRLVLGRPSARRRRPGGGRGCERSAGRARRSPAPAGMNETTPPSPADPFEELLEGLATLFAGRETSGAALATLLACVARTVGASSATLHTLGPGDPPTELSPPEASWHRPNRAFAPIDGDSARALLESGHSGAGPG